MNYYSASLRAEMFKYRKRRTPSLDGSAAGLGPVRSFRHARPATPYSHGFSRESGTPGILPGSRLSTILSTRSTSGRSQSTKSQSRGLSASIRHPALFGSRCGLPIQVLSCEGPGTYA